VAINWWPEKEVRLGRSQVKQRGGSHGDRCAAQVPGPPHTKAKRTINPDAESLMAALQMSILKADVNGLIQVNYFFVVFDQS